MAKVIAEGALGPPLARRNCSFEYDLCVSRHHHVDRLRAYERYAFAADEPRKCHLIDVFGQWKNRCHHQHRIRSDNHGDFEIFSNPLRFPVMTAPTLHALPVHAGLVLAKDLQPVEPEVPASCFWML